MLTTEEVKRMGKIMLDGGPKTVERVNCIASQLQTVSDACFADFDVVRSYLIDVINNYNKICSKEVAKQIEKENTELKAVRISCGKNKGKYVLLDKKTIVHSRYDVFNG